MRKIRTIIVTDMVGVLCALAALFALWGYIDKGPQHMEHLFTGVVLVLLAFLLFMFAGWQVNLRDKSQ